MRQGNKKILIVEDNETSQILMQEVLAYLDVALIVTGKAEKAISLFESHHEAIVLVLLDLRLPKCNGCELLRKLRAIKPDVPAVAISALQPVEITKVLEHAGFNGWMEKPFDIDRFAEMVKSFL